MQSWHVQRDNINTNVNSSFPPEFGTYFFVQFPLIDVPRGVHFEAFTPSYTFSFKWPLKDDTRIIIFLSGFRPPIYTVTLPIINYIFSILFTMYPVNWLGPTNFYQLLLPILRNTLLLQLRIRIIQTQNLVPKMF